MHPQSSSPSPSRSVRVDAPDWDARERRAALAACDLILSEGRPSAERPGLLVLDDAAQGNIDVTGGPVPSLLACVGAARPAGLPPEIPVIPADRPEALAALVLERLRAQAAPLYGLVLGGGRSERMGTDKAALAYHGKPQIRHSLELLEPLCARAFVSCRAEQAADPVFAGLPQIHDAFLGMGPMGGILSALRAHPGAAFLVIACDLPFLDAATLESLARGREPLRAATAFAGPQDGLPEPLCAIYEPRAYARALQLLGQGVDCPRKFILNSSAAILTAPDMRALRNVNDPGDYREALASI
ncbi:MAG: NTP transferase domain-containing protein [Fibrobacteres bacterium]|nr:NTP transferase domain-containing protein [Fibrobacterota bacterium]